MDTHLKEKINFVRFFSAFNYRFIGLIFEGTKKLLKFSDYNQNNNNNNLINKNFIFF